MNIRDYFSVEEFRTEYDRYIHGPIWQAIRKQRLEIDNYQCQTCQHTDNLQVHHSIFHYPPKNGWGTEDVVKDLITLCQLCHEAVTSARRQRRYDLQGFSSPEIYINDLPSNGFIEKQFQSIQPISYSTELPKNFLLNVTKIIQFKPEPFKDKTKEK